MGRRPGRISTAPPQTERLKQSVPAPNMSSGKKAPMKVVIINTQYVETDARSFKSVVQRLTGKDAKVEMEPSAQKQQKRSKSASEMANNGALFSRGMSFKEFDLLLKELPPLEELYRLYAD